METQQKDVLEVMNNAAVVMEAVRISRRSDHTASEWVGDDVDTGNWRIRFTDGYGRELSTEYSQGPGHKVWKKNVPPVLPWKGQFGMKPKPGGRICQLRRTMWSDEQVETYADFPQPLPADVLHCLVLDSYACDTSFSEWCAAFGFDTDSISKRELWVQCVENGHTLRNLFGPLWEELVVAVEDC